MSMKFIRVVEVVNDDWFSDLVSVL